MVITPWQPLRSLDIWEPLREIDSLQAEMDRFWDRFIPVGADRGTRTPIFRPPFELEETPDTLHLKVEIPGLDAKDIDIEVEKDSVYICGDRLATPVTEEKGLIRSELYYGRFERIIPLPVPVQYDRVTADYRDGILRLTLPKCEEALKKVVKVNLG